MGALSRDAAVTEADLLAGRFDGAEVRAWLVNWAVGRGPGAAVPRHFGEIVRAGGAFQAELRGLTEALNQPQGERVSDDLRGGAGRWAVPVRPEPAGLFGGARGGGGGGRAAVPLCRLGGFADRWFETRAAGGADAALRAGLVGIIKNDRIGAAGREIELWQPLGPQVRRAIVIRLEPGCDKRAETCRTKFNNFLNFRGFPHIPGEDWLTSYPVGAGVNDGGSLAR